jgi:hypothetical protein
MFIFCLLKGCNFAGLPTHSGLKFALKLTTAKAVPCFFAAFQSLIQAKDASSPRCGKVLPQALPLIEPKCV